MTDYIDRAKLIAELQDDSNWDNSQYMRDFRNRMLEVLKEQPTVDAVEGNAAQRLIDANALTAAIEDTPWYSLNNGCMVNGAKDEAGAWYKAADIFAVLNNAPTVEATPVRHGRWKDTTEFYPWEDDDGMRRYRCSECGRKILTSKECDPAVAIPYCRCGAKMDKEA